MNRKLAIAFVSRDFVRSPIIPRSARVVAGVSATRERVIDSLLINLRQTRRLLRPRRK